MELLRNKATYTIVPLQVKEIKQKMLNWSKQFSIFLFLDSNSYQLAHGSYECLLAAGASEIINDGIDVLSAIQQQHNQQRDWVFGHMCYDYKNRLERGLHSARSKKTYFPGAHFFVPLTVCYINSDCTVLTIESVDSPDAIYSAIMQQEVSPRVLPKLEFERVIDHAAYIETIGKLRGHIAEGDCYEINFCNEGFCEVDELDTLSVFNTLNEVSPAPFAAYYRYDDKYMMCASPERYLKKTGDKLLSQPIKGTARRDKDLQKDDLIKERLRNDVKERAENVMIVDLVRNDLSRCCETGSIAVDELFGIYTFPQVHQMISTVSGKLKADVPFTDAMRYSFPMGSMTGAPKYKVMQLIEQYEQSRRELFSGTVGYISPEGDFDFNVIIRSLFYNETTKYLGYQTGGAITYDSDAEKEWEEMRLKAWALERVFEQDKPAFIS